MNDLQAKRAYLRDENRKHPLKLREVPRDKFPVLALLMPSTAPRRIWRSRDFVMQMFDHEISGATRLSVNRTSIDSTGRWKDGITWDDLQRLKREAGFGEVTAIEIYPPDEHLVNDANIRHLFLVPGGHPFVWTKLNRITP